MWRLYKQLDPQGQRSSNPSTMSSSSHSTAARSRKSAPCRFYSQGHCRFGDKCKFSHEVDVQPTGKDTHLDQPVVRFNSYHILALLNSLASASANTAILLPQTRPRVLFPTIPLILAPDPSVGRSLAVLGRLGLVQKGPSVGLVTILINQHLNPPDRTNRNTLLHHVRCRS
jgi:hypothetical protein